jgi:hypothetical protein
MNGDNQMDAEDLQKLVEPVARGELDYSKANRLSTGLAWQRSRRRASSATPSSPC